MSRVTGQLRAPQNRSRVIIGVSVVAVALALAIAAWAGAFGGSATPPSQTPTVSAPLINVQEYRENGIAVNVPAGWSRTGTDSYVEYLDPAGSRWVRITSEPTTGTAHDLLQAASAGPEDASRCPAPFVPVSLLDAPVSGLTGAELEYTCGDGDAKRHGLWRAGVREGTAYHFFLSVPEAAFAESKIIYDEMVRSFTLA
jgi:hypothetical protein